MTNKTIGLIMVIWSIVWILGAVGHIKFSMDYEKRQKELDTHNQALEKRIKVYEKLADPKSVQFYVKELNKILDNMTKLIRVVESGEEIDAFFEEMSDNIDKLIGMIDDIYDYGEDIELKLEAHKAETKLQIGMTKDDIDELSIKSFDYNVNLIKKFDVIENDLRDIRNTLSQIRNSKIGTRIFK